MILLLFGCTNSTGYIDVERSERRTYHTDEDHASEENEEKDTKLHPTSAELVKNDAILKRLSELEIFSIPYPAHYENRSLGNTHNPVYWYEGKNINIQMPIKFPWEYNHKPDIYVILRYEKGYLVGRYMLEQVEYFQLPESIVTFKKPKFEKGYTYLLVTKCLYHDMWATVLK